MKPLDDIKILSLEQYGAGPFGSLHLSDLGAKLSKLKIQILMGTLEDMCLHSMKEPILFSMKHLIGVKNLLLWI